MGNYSMLLILNVSCQYHVIECSERVSWLYWRHCSNTQKKSSIFYCSVNFFSLQMFQINWTWYFSTENYSFCCCHCHSIRFYMRRKNIANFCFRDRLLCFEKEVSLPLLLFLLPTSRFIVVYKSESWNVDALFC